jgi:arginine decarboxylase
MSPWTHQDSESLYNIPKWGSGCFRINARGNVEVVQGNGSGTHAIDVHELTAQIVRRGMQAPILLRFNGILRSRVRALCGAFEEARKQFEYPAAYRAVFPIKVNQERHVVDALLEEGRKHGLGLEVGSKPELLAVITLQAGEDSLVICNGYKDREYIEIAMLSSKLGITPVLVIEKFSELETILEASRHLGVEPVIGIRTKVSGRGSGRWHESVGDRSKFGLTTAEIVKVVEELRKVGKLECLRLLHFHIGSQITQIRTLKNALRESTRMLIGLHEMGAHIDWFDVGGGLGIDYDGSKTNFESSKNYSLQEYANDVVYHLAEACKDSGIEPPTIISESGRALTAHHAVLITEVLGVSDFTSLGVPSHPDPAEPEIIHNIAEVAEGVSAKNFQESYHDVVQLRDEAMTLFNVGQLGIPERARVDEFYWHACLKIQRITRGRDYVPDDLESLERDMADMYYLNFSLFQSVPDSWAIRQLFPIMPIHRLDEEPTRRAILADITCDSDGKVDRFIDLRDVKRTLEVHPLKPGQPYYMGFFLVGAYQEILGDMHNLFGDTNVVHVDVDAQGRPKLVHDTRGDRVQDVLSYVDYLETDLLRNMRRNVEHALEDGRITYEESALIWQRYEAGLRGYTYLTREPKQAEAATPEPSTQV